MNSKNNQDLANSGFLRDIQSEVSDENAPLLRFITRNAGAIAGGVITLLLILGGWAGWNWYHAGKQKEATDELARINMQLKGEEKDKALAALAEKAPAGVKLFIYLNLGKSALENNNPDLAAEAYAKASSLGGDTALGLAAALGKASILLLQGNNGQALDLLRDVDAKLPESARSPQLRAMLAEAALKNGDIGLAQKTYREMAEKLNSPEGDYFRSRAEAISTSARTEQKSPETSTPANK